MALIEGLIVLGTVLYILYKYGTSTYDHWEKRGVNYMKPLLPFLGSGGEQLFYKRQTILESMMKMYNFFSDQRYGGIFLFRQPILVIRDPELIKKITVKDFDHFVNRNGFIDPENDPLAGKALVNLKDQLWKDMRNTLSPVFTSSKMKTMFTLVNQCGEQLTSHLDSMIKNQIDENHLDGNVVTQDIKAFFRRFTNDVIASSAFGIQIDSLKDPKNEFYVMGEDATNTNLGRIIKMFLFMLVPRVMRALKITVFSRQMHHFFRNLVTDSIKQREEKNIVRPDLIHILMQARKGALTDENDQAVKKTNVTDDDITAQALLFFFAGFETSSVGLAFLAHELAINLDVQKKLQDEIDQVIAEEKGVTYEGVMHKMKYLDMVVNEALRKWPPGPLADRLVTKRYVIPKSEDSPEVVLEKGDTVWLPVMSLHWDPEYFPDPDKFDPERFSDENKDNIVPFTYLPFGSGPRNCIGMRFALMEVKACIVYLLHKYSFVTLPKTKVPLTLDKNQFQMIPEGGFELGIKPRNSR